MCNCIEDRLGCDGGGWGCYGDSPDSNVGSYSNDHIVVLYCDCFDLILFSSSQCSGLFDGVREFCLAGGRSKIVIDEMMRF